MKVAMRIKISGGRGDGTEWPDPGVPFYVDAAEGAQLCAGGLAYPIAEEPYTETRTDPDPDMADPTRGGVKPIMNSPKAAWAHYALALRFGPAEAEAKTKADLIALLSPDP